MGWVDGWMGGWYISTLLVGYKWGEGEGEGIYYYVPTLPVGSSARLPLG